MVTVGIESTRSTKATIQVFDMMGKMVYSQPLNIVQGKNNLPVRLGNLSKGMYQVKLIGAEGSVSVIPIIKQ
jgi:Secretion system C-terminal sorting domain